MSEKIINRRTFMKGLALGAAAALANRCQAAEPYLTTPPPNFVLIIGDDISVDDFGCYGHPHIRTPSIDKLAKGGVRFTNAYLTASQCSPTRCSLITGRYPHNTGAPELHMPLPAGQPMFPLKLKEAGYYTVAAGKWHLGSYPKAAFSHRIGEAGPGAEDNWVNCLRERPRDKPFFMWFAATDAHRPWQPDGEAQPHKPSDAVIPPYMADAEGTRRDLAQYYDEVQRLDRYAGLVVAELQQQEVLENTVIMFMADNGRPFPRCKTWLWDSGIKMPLIVHWPKGVAIPGSACNSLVSMVDIGPTILALAGLEKPSAMQGVSFAQLLKDPNRQIREYVFAEHNWHDQAAHERMVRWKNYVYIRNAHPELDNLTAAHWDCPSYKDLFSLREQGKLSPAQAEIFRSPRPGEFLFDVSRDYHQINNIANDPTCKEVLEHLRKCMDKWQQATGDTVPTKLTPDRFDRKTGKTLSKGLVPAERGTIPGSERDAQNINDPGPR
ncbi:MAG: heparan N-sulfatase [Candidatus Brocadiia bacterium]|nr:MAG: heparan N-sulfatase [Candidatus Brocadiia bacterium]